MPGGSSSQARSLTEIFLDTSIRERLEYARTPTSTHLRGILFARSPYQQQRQLRPGIEALQQDGPAVRRPGRGAATRTLRAAKHPPQEESRRQTAQEPEERPARLTDFLRTQAITWPYSKAIPDAPQRAAS